MPNVEKRDIVFPADKKPQQPIYFFDAVTATKVINAAVYPFKLCCSSPQCADSESAK